MRELFRGFFYDEENRKMESVKLSSDDTLFINNVVEMQKAGMKVHCNAGDGSLPRKQIKLSGNDIEVGLYYRLLDEFEMKTKKHLNKW